MESVSAHFDISVLFMFHKKGIKWGSVLVGFNWIIAPGMHSEETSIQFRLICFKFGF